MYQTKKGKPYDRDNPGRSVRDLIFPGGKSVVIYAKYEEEPDLAEQLLTRLASLGEEHPLNGQNGEIREGIDKCKTALSVYHEAIKAEKLKEAEEEIAKSNLGRQYEFNYLDLVREFGKKYANRFFPIIRSSGKSAKEENDNEGDIE